MIINKKEAQATVARLNMTYQQYHFTVVEIDDKYLIKTEPSQGDALLKQS